MEYSIGTVRSDKAGFSEIAGITDATAKLTFGYLAINFSNCSFFDANMAAPLSAALERVKSQENIVEIVGLRSNVKTILCKNRFLCEYGFRRISDNNKTALPYTCFDLTQSKGFWNYLSAHLDRDEMPIMSNELEKKFRQSILEMFQNCVMHSSATSGVFVCGQFYPHDKRLKLTISDGGIGIRTSARKVPTNKMISSVDAIKWALKEGNTSKSGSEPGGFGLKLLQEFVELNKGKVQVVSRYGYYEFDGSHAKFEKMTGDLQGTTVNLEINTDDKKAYKLTSELTSKDIF
ncbi:ATP-binding protein [Burkholderia gladioli]|uniref:ATP-binding protein n=1 Tax=Burkholderia gladioli TaxID=28095 RepID=UPI0016407B36|nr:ATP-binding protein [Burkholderia gladioli]